MTPGGRRAVFLDRDGVVNVEVHRLTRPDQLQLIEGAGEGIRLLNGAGIPVFLVTNQAVIARGLCTEDELRSTHGRLVELLERDGALLDGIYYCPHHPDGVVDEYRQVCSSRKPGTGMLDRAAQEHGIDLGRSVMIGDRTVDIETAVKAGCASILVSTGYGGSDELYPATPTWTAPDLPSAARIALQSFHDQSG